MKRLISVVSLIGMICMFSMPVSAASNDECAIWLCLPSGFPSGCGGAKSAMKDRLKKFKPPLPSFGSCRAKSPSSIGGGSTMSAIDGFAAYLPERRGQCLSWSKPKGKNDNQTCLKWQILPEQYIKNATCRRNARHGNTPSGCNSTKRFVDVMIDGKKTGETFYF